MSTNRWGAAAIAAFMAVSAPHVAKAADSWDVSFPAEAVLAHAEVQGGQIAVLAADVRSRAAAAALVAALRAGGAAKVRDGKSLGSLAKLDDPAILARAKALGAERVLIVRVFEGDEAEAVVSIYTADGTTVGGFTAQPGVAIEPPPSRLGGHDVDLAASIATVEEESEQVSEEFHAREIVFDQSLHIIASGNAATVTRQFHPRTGAGKPLAGADFYRYVGRDDLATKYKRRRGTRIGLGVGGAVAAVAGLGLMFGYGLGKGLSAASRTCDYDSPDFDACEDRNDAEGKKALRIGLGGGTALLVAGTVLGVVAVRIGAHPVSGTEAIGMAQTFNDDLRKQLGLPKRSQRAQASASLSAGREGAGVLVQGRF